MDTATLFLLTVSVLGLALYLWSARRRLGGVWIEELDDGRRREITLRQYGPLVRGVHRAPGGRQIFKGFVTGRRLRLARFDRGLEMLTGQGFPEPVARKLEGELMGRYEFELQESGELEGHFYPMYVSFSQEAPIRILEKRLTTPRRRRWRRVFSSRDRPRPGAHTSRGR